MSDPDLEKAEDSPPQVVYGTVSMHMCAQAEELPD